MFLVRGGLYQKKLDVKKHSNKKLIEKDKTDQQQNKDNIVRVIRIILEITDRWGIRE